MAPKINLTDPYLMAQFAIDEALRSLVATGADLDHVSALDHFCWPDALPGENNPDFSQKLAALVRSSFGMSEALKVFGIPLISGKDSMKNDYRHEKIKISILPTLLITMLSKTNIANVVSSSFKESGHTVFLIGKKCNNLKHSIWEELFLAQNTVPEINLKKNFKHYHFLSKAIKTKLISAGHDVSEGGLVVTLIEMMMGEKIGFKFSAKLTSAELFSESPGRIVISVPKAKVIEFKNLGEKSEAEIWELGETTATSDFCLPQQNISLEKLNRAYQKLNAARSLC